MEFLLFKPRSRPKPKPKPPASNQLSKLPANVKKLIASKMNQSTRAAVSRAHGINPNKMNQMLPANLKEKIVRKMNTQTRTNYLRARGAGKSINSNPYFFINYGDFNFNRGGAPATYSLVRPQGSGGGHVKRLQFGRLYRMDAGDSGNAGVQNSHMVGRGRLHNVATTVRDGEARGNIYRVRFAMGEYVPEPPKSKWYTPNTVYYGSYEQEYVIYFRTQSATSEFLRAVQQNENLKFEGLRHSYDKFRKIPLGTVINSNVNANYGNRPNNWVVTSV